MRIFALEDVRLAIPEDSYAKVIERAMDSVKDTLYENLDNLYEIRDQPSFCEDIERTTSAAPEGDIGTENYYDFG